MVRLDLPHGSGVGSVMGDIGRWLDGEGIKAVGVKSAEAPSGNTVEVSFSSDEDAERFRQRFVQPQGKRLVAKPAMVSARHCRQRAAASRRASEATPDPAVRERLEKQAKRLENVAHHIDLQTNPPALERVVDGAFDRPS